MDIVLDEKVVGELSENGVVKTEDIGLLTVLALILQKGVEVVDGGDDFALCKSIRLGEEGYPRALYYALWQEGYIVKAKPKEVKIPKVEDKLEPQLAEAVLSSFREEAEKFLTRLDADLSQEEVREALDVFIQNWLEGASAAALPISWRLYDAGLKTGMRDTGVDVSRKAHRLGRDWIVKHPNGILEAIHGLAEEQRKGMAKVIKNTFEGKEPFQKDVLKKRILEVADVGQARAAKIVRTEIAKVSNSGRILAWMQDPMKDSYNYNWIAVHDHRMKPISKVLEDNGPYTLEVIADLWHDPTPANCKKHGLEGADKIPYWQNDVFNQRCSLTRTIKR